MPIIRKDRVWPAIVVVVLGGYVTFGVTAARIAGNDPHHGIEADYYKKGVAWDSTIASTRRSEALGWRVVPSLGPVTLTGAALRLELLAPDGAPVSDAAVSLEARHVAHADDVVRIALGALGAGTYHGQLPLRRPGLWELRLVATRGADRFATDIRMDASTLKDGAVVDARPGDAAPERLKAGAQ